MIDFAGIRIAGISGVFSHRNYDRGHFEHAPYDRDSVKSVYHMRHLHVYRLKQVVLRHRLYGLLYSLLCVLSIGLLWIGNGFYWSIIVCVYLSIRI